MLVLHMRLRPDTVFRILSPACQNLTRPLNWNFIFYNSSYVPFNTALSFSFRLCSSTNRTKGDQPLSAFSSWSIFANASPDRLDRDLRSSRHIPCCVQCSTCSCTGGRSDGKKRHMKYTRGRSPSIRGLPLFPESGEARQMSAELQ